MNDFVFKSVLAIAVLFQIGAGLGIITALTMIVMNGFSGGAL